MKILFDETIKQKFVNLYTISLPKETGGILFGYYSEDLKTAIITDIFYNIEDSREKLRSFYRGKKGFKKFSKKMWAEDKYYLGEWHTHPFSLPNLSAQDKKEMIKIKDNKRFKCPEPILAIVGEIENHITLQAYIFLINDIYCERINI